jgi:nicotinic acid phosphoribosyltransferase
MTQPSPEAAERPAMADMTNWCVTHTSKLGRRRPIPDHELRALVISYDVRADTLTMSAGDITRTVRRFRAQLDRRGIADEFTIDLSADSTGISADRIAMFDNFSVSGAVSQ